MEEKSAQEKVAEAYQSAKAKVEKFAADERVRAAREKAVGLFHMMKSKLGNWLKGDFVQDKKVQVCCVLSRLRVWVVTNWNVGKLGKIKVAAVIVLPFCLIFGAWGLVGGGEKRSMSTQSTELPSSVCVGNDRDTSNKNKDVVEDLKVKENNAENVACEEPSQSPCQTVTSSERVKKSEIAKEDSGTKPRARAVLDPGWKPDPDEGVRFVEASQTDNAAVLEYFIRNDSSDRVRSVALDNPHLENQALFAEVAKQSKSDDCRRVAIDHLNVQDALAFVALHDSDMGLRCAAAGKITDQKLLADVYRGNEDRTVRETATRVMKDQKFLASIAMEDKDDLIKAMAAEVLTDQEELKKLVCKSNDQLCRENAVKKINDEKFLFGIGMNDENLAVAAAATLRIKDEKLLGQIVLGCKHDTTPGYAGDSPKRTAVEMLKDNEILEKIARESTSEYCRFSATSKISDRTILESLRNTAKDPQVRSCAIETLAGLKK